MLHRSMNKPHKLFRFTVSHCCSLKTSGICIDSACLQVLNGDSVGEDVGDRVGNTLGELDGEIDGDMDGDIVGANVG